jgi:hypothetical protein
MKFNMSKLRRTVHAQRNHTKRIRIYATDVCSNTQLVMLTLLQQENEVLHPRGREVID